MIEVKNLTRRYGATLALDDVSFAVGAGEVVGFLGPNGAGKSSTMQIISGNLAPSAGQVSIAGIDMLDRPKRAKREIGYLAEQPPVYRELTVNEYLHYCAKLNRIARGSISRAVDTAKQRCGLGDVGTRLIGNLSKGYQQRVGIAQAIIHTPAVVVLDEPEATLLGAARLAAGMEAWCSPAVHTVEPTDAGAYLPEKFPRWQGWLTELLAGGPPAPS